MKRSVWLPLALMSVLCACGEPAAPPAAKTPKAAPSATSASGVVTANNYSGGEYVAGVRSVPGPGGMFYFLMPPDAQVPLRVGSTLVFARTGKAKVVRIDSAPQGGQVAVFVQVDKSLDPAGDGFPNPIRIE